MVASYRNLNKLAEKKASFDSYILFGNTRQKLCEGIGRSVPPNMMQAIAENIKVNILDKIK